jgi:diamine N-acetyltransferase
MSDPAPAAEALPPRLRPTLLSDLDFVIEVERDPRNLPFITPWERPQHEAAVRIPDFRHFIVELPVGGGSAALAEPVGFVILQGCRSPHRSVELKRIVLLRHDQGLGRACLRRLVAMAFADLHAHRFWLDVKARNTRALALYRSEGFVEEGRLRQAVRVSLTPGGLGEGYDDLVVLSRLRTEHERASAIGAEPPETRVDTGR